MENSSITFEEIQKSTLYLRAKLDAAYDGIAKQGITVMDPYRGNPICLRLMREAFFRLRLPLRAQLFYNSAVKRGQYRFIIAEDPLLTRDYLLWLQKNHPESRIIVSYKNLVGRSQSVLPGDIPEGIASVTFDRADAKKYGMELNSRLYITPDAKVKPLPEEFDAVFIGRDKGRMAYLRELETRLNAEGLRTYFHIVKNRRYYPNKKGYRPELTYKEILGYVARTRAIINIVYRNQEGLTVRDMEAAINGKKLITNNSAIKNAGFYDPDNVFILQERSIGELPAFLDKPFIPLPEDFFEKNSLFGWLKVTLGYESN